MKIEILDHIHIYSADPESSASFYIDHFEASELFRNENVHGQTRIFLSLGGQFLVLGPFPPGIAPSAPPAPGDGAYTHGFGLAHFGLKVKDVEAAQARVIAATRSLEETGEIMLGGHSAEDDVIQ